MNTRYAIHPIDSGASFKTLAHVAQWCSWLTRPIGILGLAASSASCAPNDTTASQEPARMEQRVVSEEEIRRAYELARNINRDTSMQVAIVKKILQGEKEIEEKVSIANEISRDKNHRIAITSVQLKVIECQLLRNQHMIFRSREICK